MWPRGSLAMFFSVQVGVERVESCAKDDVARGVAQVVAGIIESSRQATLGCVTTSHVLYTLPAPAKTLRELPYKSSLLVGFILWPCKRAVCFIDDEYTVLYTAIQYTRDCSSKRQCITIEKPRTLSTSFWNTFLNLLFYALNSFQKLLNFTKCISEKLLWKLTFYDTVF